MTFSKNEVVGNVYTKTIRLNDLPALYNYVITEVYSGNYTSEAIEGLGATYSDTLGRWTVTINNSHNGYTPGSGVVNKYEDGSYVQPGGSADGGEPSAGSEGRD